MGVISADVTITAEAATGISVRIDQVQPTEGVPGFARKFAGETTRVVQTEEWDSAQPAAPSRSRRPGKPTSINGTLSLDGVGRPHAPRPSRPRSR